MGIFQNPLVELVQYRELLMEIQKQKAPLSIQDLTDISKAHFITEILSEKEVWKLVITYEENKARQLYQNMKTFQENVFLYPAKDVLFFYADIQSHRITKERIEIWQHIIEDKEGIIVTTIDALMDLVEEYGVLRSLILSIYETDSIDLEKLIEKLIALGYERLPQVEGIGQFSIRGGIIDIYPITYENPVRIELWGEEIDSIRYFEVNSQRSIDNIKEIHIYPAKERELMGRVSFLEYFPQENTLIFLDEVNRIYEHANLVEKEFKGGMVGRLESGQITAKEMPMMIPAKDILEALTLPYTICLSSLGHHNNRIKIYKEYSILSRQLVSSYGTWELWIGDLKRYQRENYRVILCISSYTRQERLIKSLKGEGIFVKKIENAQSQLQVGDIYVIYAQLQHSFEYPELRFVVLSDNDMAEYTKKKYRRKKLQKESGKISSLSQLHIGDYVIHEDYGLGRYQGIEQIEREEAVRDYVKIEYAGGEYCYVPTTKLDRIQKYMDNREKPLKLNRLGASEWTKTKQRVKNAIENIAKDLVQLYSTRLSGKGYQYQKDSDWQREFEELFPYEETEDQLRAITQVKQDMEQGKIMDRLICGDVGYGKTEIALRAAFKSIQEGKQVIYLAPTTILAQQHYNTFIQRMKNFPVKVDLLCRFRSANLQRQTLLDFQKGFVDIIIGTHRVLSKDIIPRDLGLVIIDEEQRFGVTHKEKLKKLKENVNVLTLTATPIPRTLHMSLVGIRDLSILEEAPIDRKPIQTYVMEYHIEIVREAISRELARNGQVYYIYNQVKDIQEITIQIQSIVPDAVVEYAHGQMPKQELEDIIMDFINGEIDVLVSTTIVETGLDIPNANTMIIHHAENFGLSQLYQLRGRIGRSSRTSYAFLMYKKKKNLTEEADKRLKAIKEFTELGSGIQIAMRDLEIRGAGNVLGAEQHGHMQAVGYELYCKLLGIAIQKIKGEQAIEIEFDTSIDITVDAYIPSYYIGNEEQKLDIYQRIASIHSIETYMDIQDELLDRFGEIVPPVTNLLNVARLKNLAHRIYITEIIIRIEEIRFILYEKPEFDTKQIPILVEKLYPDLKIRNGNKVEFYYQEKNRLKKIEDMLQKALEMMEVMVDVLDKKV